MLNGYLVLETGEVYEGDWAGGKPRAGEIVFNTSHSGYEEIATDPSYFSQILVMTAPHQGNYGVDQKIWESRQVWLSGFVCLSLQNSQREQTWQQRLTSFEVPILHGIDTRSLVLRLREQGTPWGALVNAKSADEAKILAVRLIQQKKSEPTDWVAAVSRTKLEEQKGKLASGPRVAILDFGVKENTLRELKNRCSQIAIFPSRASAQEILAFRPAGVLLSNGPGDPMQVEKAVDTVKGLLGQVPVFGICMGHQILALALGAKTYKLKYGHRGGNHPVKDLLLNKIYVTSQNHGYAVDTNTLPKSVSVTHTNLNDQTVEGISCFEQNCWSVQFHPESHPGPREARELFDFFTNRITLANAK